MMNQKLASPRGKVNLYQNFLNKTSAQQIQQQQQKVLQHVEKSAFQNELQESLKRRQQIQPVVVQEDSEPQPRLRKSVKNKPSMKTEQGEQEDMVVGRLSSMIKNSMIAIETDKVSQFEECLHAPILKGRVLFVVIKFYKILQAKIVLKKLKQKFKYRCQIIQEIIQTEKSYNDRMKLLVHQVIVPLRNEKKLTSQDVAKLFSNIDAIQQFSDEILDYFQRKYKNFAPNSMIADELVPMLHFFKLYFQYAQNYNDGQKLFKKLSETNKQFIDFIKNVQLKLGQPITSSLIEPIQRLPRYLLLFKELLKNTAQIHKDYKNLQLCIELLENVNDQNNKILDKILQNQKMFELQRQYGDIIQIAEAGRDFKKEMILSVYFRDEKDLRSPTVYLFSDLILITERDQKVNTKYVLRQYLRLNKYSYIRKFEDLENYDNLYQVGGMNGTLTFSLNEKEVEIIAQIIEQLIEKQIEKEKAMEKFNQQLVHKQVIKIDILGTQEMIDTTQNTFTQYIMEFDIQGIVQKVFLRFKSFKKIQQYVKQQFPKLSLPYLKDDQWLSKAESLVIEQRKIAMLDFLQTLFNNEEFQTSPSQVLRILGLADNFFDLPQIYEEQKQLNLQKTQQLFRGTRKPMSQQVEALESLLGGSNIRTHLKKDSYNYYQPITPRGGPVKPNVDISDIQKNGNYSTNISTKSAPRSNSLIQNRKISAQKLIQFDSRNGSKRGSIHEPKELSQIEIKVVLFKHPKQIEKSYKINQDTKASDLLEDIAKDIDLQYAYDFKLYLQDKLKNQPLDEDQRLWDILIKDESKLTEFLHVNRKPIYNEKRLQLRKHLFLPEKQERDYFDDPVRVELFTYQHFNDITSGVIRPDLNVYVKFASLYLILMGYEKIRESTIPYESIKEFVPEFAFKKIKVDVWKSFLPQLLNNFSERISVEYNTLKEQCDQNIKKKQYYAHLVVLDLVLCDFFYGLTVFKVQPEKDIHQVIDELNRHYWEYQSLKGTNKHQPAPLELNSQILLCIGFECIKLYQNLYSKQVFFEIQYDSITNVKLFTQSIQIEIEPTFIVAKDANFQIKKQYLLKFTTDKSYQIKSLLNEYNLYRIEIDQEMECEEVVI
ncbi:hypothetical protein pb186bvf_002305 [Paramecium bursaria]